MAEIPQRCVPCEGGVLPLTLSEANELLLQIPGWKLEEQGGSIVRTFKYKNFADALAFVNKVGAIAEAQGHHPDISFGWGSATVSLTTHAIKGLSLNDFTVAKYVNDIR